MIINKIKRPTRNDAVICGQGFLAGFLVSNLRFPIHELGHCIGGWVVGARDMQIDYRSAVSYEVEHFSDKRRAIFMLGGPIMDRAIVLSGYYLLHRSNIITKLVGLCMSLYGLNTPLTTVFYISGNLEKAYRGDIEYMETNDEIKIAKYLDIGNPAILFLLEASFDIFIVVKTFRHIPNPKLLTILGSFSGMILGTLLYGRYFGPTFLPEIKQNNT